MTVTPRITVSDGRLTVRRRTVLTGVPDNRVGGARGRGGARRRGLRRRPRRRGQEPPRLHLRHAPRMGVSGRDVPLETQFMLVEVPASDGDGDGDDPPRTWGQGGADGPGRAHGVPPRRRQPLRHRHRPVKAVEKHLQTFHHRDKKKLPSFLDWFGWCTWDAFYTDVTADGVKHGLQSLSKGGAPARFLIIDDGWQQIASENKPDPNVAVQEGAQFASRLTGIKENTKFQTKPDGDGDGEQAAGGLKRLVAETKDAHGVKQVYVWHAMAGYWGGVTPTAGTAMERYEPALAYPVQSPGVTGNQPDIVMDSLSVLGLGLVPRAGCETSTASSTRTSPPAASTASRWTCRTSSRRWAPATGRVAITRAYHRALEASVARSFPDNGCISCMCHNSDMLYSARQTAVVRASDDFYPRDPASHTVHVASVAYNTVFLGEFMQPDWDMFHSLHPAAEYHGAARAIGGCPIYVSDKPGNHNFELLRKLVLPDGSVLRAQLPGRPTRDCLFSDPARDGER
ncbi:putative galactinol--sucrose galactosyltransferase 2 [Zea mays]|uniref:galactinol--sucrose galactosyltransferase n=1 Tax=Zea mays TaxID=4577 RepID=A0A3L6D6A0_MAIZE|nr:putative galactinol--sucrose galactosyltransferase 2 [Zea mays]